MTTPDMDRVVLLYNLEVAIVALEDARESGKGITRAMVNHAHASAAFEAYRDEHPNKEHQMSTYAPVTDDTCTWLVQVPSGREEIDFPEDLYRIVDCGGALEVNEHGSWRCEYGHEHISFDDPARDAYEAEMAFNERYED